MTGVYVMCDKRDQLLQLLTTYLEVLLRLLQSIRDFTRRERRKLDWTLASPNSSVCGGQVYGSVEEI
jgi:hypothetical protein